MIVSVHCVFAKNEAIHYVHLFFLQCGTTVLTCGAHPSMTFCCRILEADGPDCNVILGCVQPAEIELSYPRVSTGLLVVSLGLLLWVPTAVWFLLRV